MKKYIILISLLILSSCFWNDSKVEDAKKRALWWDDNSKEVAYNETDESSNDTNKEVEQTIESDDTSTVDVPYVEVENITEEQIFTIPNLPTITTATRRFSINGYIGGEYNVDKIVVSFSNDSSDYPDDVYTLWEFNPWDSTFTYNAIKENYNVLDFWLNEYVVEAYIWDKVFSKKVIVYLPEMQDLSSWVTYESKWFWTEENYKLVKFPENSSSFGSVIEMKDWEFAYSKVDWFRIFAWPVDEYSCANSSELSDYLISKFWFVYWNTCVSISSGDWLYVNVLQLKNDTHKYFRYYIDNKNNLEWIKDLASGYWIVTKDNIWEKNKEFKAKDFSLETGFSDTIFNLLIKND